MSSSYLYYHDGYCEYKTKLKNMLSVEEYWANSLTTYPCPARATQVAANQDSDLIVARWNAQIRRIVVS
jgi:hypothetical protein